MCKHNNIQYLIHVLISRSGASAPCNTEPQCATRQFGQKNRHLYIITNSNKHPTHSLHVIHKVVSCIIMLVSFGTAFFKTHVPLCIGNGGLA